jgi:CRISPR-associated protein Csm1
MLFEKHFSRVPSITMRIYDGLKKEEIKEKHPDISLYDHSKLTAAIAGCMYHYCKETHTDKWNNNELLKDEVLKVPSNVYPYLLIGGDISGVQRFIYTITSKGALKSLKGRSFFLELLSEHIVAELLQELNITRCNLVFSGGGHFYILSYNTPSAEIAVRSVKNKIDDYLFSEFKGNLQLHLETAAFLPDEFKKASGIWERLSEKIEASKKKKWNNRINDLLKVEMPYADEDKDKDCRTQSCEVCFREDLPLQKLSKGDDDLLVCEPCSKQHQLGEMLVGISKKHFPVLYKFTEKPTGDFIKIDNAYYTLKKGWDESLHLKASAIYRVND